jgi:hypothetical protein
MKMAPSTTIAGSAPKLIRGWVKIYATPCSSGLLLVSHHKEGKGNKIAWLRFDQFTLITGRGDKMLIELYDNIAREKGLTQ